MKQRNIVRHDEAQPDAEVLGGKGCKLAELGRAGHPVPPWLCVTTAAGAAAGPDGLAPEDAAALLACFDEVFTRDAFVAVRSSASDEDSTGDSFAGQLETFLYVTREDLLEHVARVLRSAGSASVALYRRARGLGEAPARPAVLVQLMVDASVSGVLFTANPTTGARDEAVVTAGLGLGEGVVADLVETDTYQLALATGEVRARDVAEKTRRVVFDRGAGGGTRVEPLPDGPQLEACLDDAQLVALCALAREVHEQLGEPQDIEWAFDGAGALHLLQSRPITTLDREQIFDNANIVESYPGLSTPLTYSHARRCYEETFRQSSRQWGIPEAILRERWSVHANLLALINGRIYYNILNWYELFLFVPGFEGILPAWERALGLSARHIQRREGKAKDKAWALWRGVRRFQSLTREVEAFQAEFGLLQVEFYAKDLSRLSAHELYELYEELCRRFLAPYAVSLANDAFAQQLYDRLGKLIEQWDLGDPAALRNNLLCGETGMDSVEPVRSILGLAKRIRASAPLRALFEGDLPAEVVWRELHDDGDDAHAAFREALAEHLRRYGDRTLHELKLETPLSEEDPAFLVAMLRNYVRGGQDLDVMEARERSVRGDADAAVERALRGHPLRRRTFRWVLEHTRRTVKFRENLRLSRSRSAGMVKRLFRALGGVFARKGLFDDPADVLWLTVEELGHQLRGHAVNRDLRALIGLRKAEYAAYADSPPPPARLVTQGPVYLNQLSAPQAQEALSEGELTGIGCSPGRVRARAKIILDPAADMQINGEILVSPMTDPGWVFLMVAAGGLVVERGSVLSHTAIIGRELGIPTVVAVAQATRRIKDGDLLELDGQAGTVRIVEEG